MRLEMEEGVAFAIFIPAGAGLGALVALVAIVVHRRRRHRQLAADKVKFNKAPLSDADEAPAMSASKGEAANSATIQAA